MAVTAYAGGQASPEKIDGLTSSKPVPSFNRPPRIDPAGGVVGDVLTVKDGDVLNGTIVRRQWLLNETAIRGAVGLTIATAIAGSYSVRSVAGGDGGEDSETSPPVLIRAVGGTPTPTPSVPMFQRTQFLVTPFFGAAA